MYTPFLNKNRLSQWEIYFLLVQVIGISALWIGVTTYSRSDNFRNFVSYYCWASILGPYLFGYVSLRKIGFFVTHFLLSLINIPLYYELIQRQELNYVKSHAADGLWSIPFFLLLIQILRYFHRSIYSTELVAPSRSGEDIFDGRKCDLGDYVSFVFYMMCFIIIVLWSVIKRDVF